jgi:hypothetical protein
MSSYRYTTKTLTGDYIRGGIGVVVTGSLLVAVQDFNVFHYVVIAGLALFGGFTFRTWQRHKTSYELSEEGIWANGPLGKALRWTEITGIRLKYFSTRRDRKEGWFQLTVVGAPGKVSVDSDLDGFDAFLQACVPVIHANQLELSEPTTENFAAAGFPVRADAAGESTSTSTTEEE